MNVQCRLAARPVGLPKASDWDIVEETSTEPEEGQFRVQVDYLSVDPAMRSWMNAGRSYVPPVEIGEVMRAGGIGRVIDSRHPDHAVGETVYGGFGVQRYAISDGTGVTPVDTTVAPAPIHLGVLGIGGLTAYFGLLDIGRPQPGETVVVSGAAGSVGSIAGQIARIKGCRVVGIAGGQDKCSWLVDELGFDAAICASTPRRASTSFSTMSVARSSTQRSAVSHGAPAWSSAEPSLSTTPRRDRAARRTTCSCSSLAPR
jgi:NADPH-dependent curcumin reductase CurA